MLAAVCLFGFDVFAFGVVCGCDSWFSDLELGLCLCSWVWFGWWFALFSGGLRMRFASLLLLCWYGAPFCGLGGLFSVCGCCSARLVPLVVPGACGFSGLRVDFLVLYS